MLKFSGVKKTFGSITALEDINLDIAKGEFVFITGPSGSGKTTLIRLILRELLPDEGEIVIAGEDITKMPRKFVPALRQQIGTVFQDFKVLPERTLEENVELALAVLGIPQDEWKKRVENVLDLTRLKDRRKLFPAQLSGGELQRVSLARALVINPKLILADEPTGNLDWVTAQELMDLFKQINKEGKTIIMATHHRGIVDNESFREIVLEKGKVTRGAKETSDEKHMDDGVKKSEKVGEKSVDNQMEKANKDKKESSVKVHIKKKDAKEIEKKEENGDDKKDEKKRGKHEEKKKVKMSIRDKIREKFKNKKS